MKKVISELIKTSTAYGLPNIFRSERFFNKLFWLSFMIFSVTIASYYIFNDLVDYHNFEVVTTIKTEYDQPTQFPTVSFCHFEKSYDTKDFFESLSKFDNDVNVGSYPSNHYESFISQRYGICFRFNSGKNMTNHSIPIKNSTTGREYDAYELHIHAPYGLVLWIHNKSSVPKFSRNKIHLSAGFFNFIEVERTFESKLEEPYNKCLKDVSKFKKNKTLVDYFLNQNLSYSQEECLDLCFELFYIQENQCQCKGAELGNVFENCFAIAEKQNYTGCTWKYRSNFINTNLVEKCSEYCPLECDSWSLTHFIVASKYEKFGTLNLTHLRIYYKSLKYTSITQQAKTRPEQLISNLGGYLGLFVGLSFISLFEIIEIIIEIIYIFLRKQKMIQPSIRQDNENISRTELEILKLENKENKEKLKELRESIVDILMKIEKK